MPELPEVETWRRALARWLAGRSVVQTLVAEPTSVRAQLGTRPVTPTVELLRRAEAMVGPAGETARHGKRLGLRVGDDWWLVHLGMTGRFERTGREAPAHGRVGWVLDDGSVVWFRDARRFGGVVPLDGRDALARGLGPDALEPLSGAELAARFSGRRSVKVALLDQSCIAGLGNIHAVEALWRAGVAPTRPVGRLTSEEWARLAEAIPAQLAASVEEVVDGEDFVYVTDGGENPFAVYGREGEACRRCGEAVRRAVHSGRSTFWCVQCQPAG